MSRMLYLFMVSFTIFVYQVLGIVGQDADLVVTTRLGPIKGATMQTVLGKTIYAFRGIRYAKPPIKEFRFQPPVPVEPWTTIYDATKNREICPQHGHPEPQSSEDCLFLNVYTTKLPFEDSSVKRPVVVYFHAGGFYSGAAISHWAGPEYLLDQEIVLVMLNYRLGALGFISTGDQHAPGNNGLKDQVLALKWAKDNAAAFGGDPNLITIAGYGAGGASVSLHLVSPMSKGLFQRAIIMSSSSYGNWPVPHEQFSLAQKQARLVGCPSDTSLNIINCLKTKPAQDIGGSTPHFAEFGREPRTIWLPVIEKDYGQERFLTDNPAKLIQCGEFEQVPVIATVNTDEFAYHALDILNNDTLLQEINNNFEKVAPIAFIYERDTNNSRHISKELRKFYFGNEPISNQTKSGLEKLFADGIVGFSVHRTVDLLATKSTKAVFYYQFDYQGQYSHAYLPGTKTPFGVVHEDEFIYLFLPYFPKLDTKSKDYKIVTTLTTLIANFAKTGKPTSKEQPILNNVDWEPYTLEHHKYLYVSDKPAMRENLFSDRYAVWDKVFPMPHCS